MKVVSLQSGSNGNCIYVEAVGVRLLFDAGISGRQAQLRLAAHDRDISTVDALLISHDHRDHARCMGIYQRKFGIPVHVTKKTLAVAKLKDHLGRLDDIRHYDAGSSLRFGKITVETIRTPHDCEDGVAFVVDDGHKRLGILTDLGHVFCELKEVIQSLNAVLIESNYDPTMLENGVYPEYLRQRIRGPHGHLSNDEAAKLLVMAKSRRLKWACLAHLSEQNNHPSVALRTHRRIIGDQLNLHVASRHQATDVLEV